MTRVGALAVVVATMCTFGCATIAPSARTEPHPPLRTWTTVVILHGTPLELHLAMPASTSPPDAVVVYASGDGGWFGTAVDMFRTIAAHGHPTVGFSARAFLRIERPPHAKLNARQLAADYATILTDARRALRLPPETPAILTGWSRGAAFAAIAASEPPLRDHVRGVIAIGLAADETLSVDGDDTDDGPSSHESRPGALHPYECLRQLEPVRGAVIQAVHDDYLAAERAREIFGPDTAHRRFYAVPARNHRFAGGHDAFVAALVDALSWLGQSDVPAT